MYINKFSGKTPEQPNPNCYLYFQSLVLRYPVRIVKDILPIGLKAIVNKYEQNAGGMYLIIIFDYFQTKIICMISK